MEKSNNEGEVNENDVSQRKRLRSGRGNFALHSLWSKIIGKKKKKKNGNACTGQ